MKKNPLLSQVQLPVGLPPPLSFIPLLQKAVTGGGPPKPLLTEEELLMADFKPEANKNCGKKNSKI